MYQVIYKVLNNMKKNRICSIVSLLGVSLVGMSASVLTVNVSAIAETMTQEIETSAQNAFDQQTNAVRIGFVPPAGEGMPRHTRGGATRGSCDALQVLPESGSGLTTAAKPMLQVYVRENVANVSVTIEADDGSEYYEYEEGTHFALSAGNGIVDVPLPETLVALTPEKQYTWSLILMCGEGVDAEEIGPNAPVIKGGIRRVSPLFTGAEGEQLSLEEKATLYSENGLWYDLVATMRMMQTSEVDSTEVEQQWAELLISVGLDTIVEETASAR